MLEQFIEHLNKNNYQAIYQSACRSNYSCETAIMKVINDVLTDFNPNSFVIMTFLDFSAAFDTVDHTILINRLEKQFGIAGTALTWFRSYLENRSYMIKINNTFSNKKLFKFGVPQGSILGPIFYSVYVKDIEEITLSYNVKVHVYADDVVLYAKCSKLTNLKEWLCKVMQWASGNFLMLNKNKTSYYHTYLFPYHRLF